MFQSIAIVLSRIILLSTTSNNTGKILMIALFSIFTVSIDKSPNLDNQKRDVLSN